MWFESGGRGALVIVNRTMSDSTIMSVVLIVDAKRASGQRVLNALEKQTCSDSVIEIIVSDFSPAEVKPLNIPSRFKHTYLRFKTRPSWQEARTTAAKEASGSIVAFIEDHCYPHPDWAEKLIAAHADGRWAAVGYAITNGSPDSYWSRCSLLSDYGYFAHPAPGGPTKILPGSNITYARWFLEEIGKTSGGEAGVDYNIQQEALARGHRMKLAADALAAHVCVRNIFDSCAAHFSYVRVLSHARSRNGAWSGTKRLVWATGAMLLMPMIRLARLARSVWPRGSLRTDFIVSIPPLLVIFTAAAIGEAVGYLAGLGDAESNFLRYELNAPRLE